MYKIYTVNTNATIGFAAFELEKYLRMLMPRAGSVSVSHNPHATDGFRLGLMSDFGLTPDVDDVFLDDVVYYKTDENGGVIAGSNPRSVLLAVYRYLKHQGCRWLFPGPDGENIPTIDRLQPAELLHKASFRYRGQATEGSETQQIMLEAIDFTPKVGLNTFMVEFEYPYGYYARAYNHPITKPQVLKWKRALETEMEKRGLLFHDVGHGWTAEPFGFHADGGWKKVDPSAVSAEQRKHLPMFNGERKFFNDIPTNTNFCMSNAESRAIVAKYVANYAEKQKNVDFLHVWLADDMNNHCECDTCVQKRPSDWYVMLLNDIDAELTARNLDTHIVFIAYLDTMWGPLTETIKNKKRFTLTFAPITRSYSETYQVLPAVEVNEFKRNALMIGKGMAMNLAYLNTWKKHWKGDCFTFEYHFWRIQYLDLGTMHNVNILYNDIQGLKQCGLSGVLENGSQRSYFPTGFPFYLYGEALFDESKSFAELQEEYFEAAFGDNWRVAAEYLEAVTQTEVFQYAKGEMTPLEGHQSPFYQPQMCPAFAKAQKVAEQYVPKISKYLDEAVERVHHVSWELLKWHIAYVKGTADFYAACCVGNADRAWACLDALSETMAPLVLLHPTTYDHRLCIDLFKRIPNMLIQAQEITQ